MSRRPRSAGRPGSSNNVRSVRRFGFTLIEMMVATVLVGIGVASVFGGIRSLTKTDLKAREAALLQRLAVQKFNQLGNVANPDTEDNKGDFTDQGYADVSWTLTVEASGTENVEQVTVTATRGDEEQSLTGLVFVRPTTTTTTATGATQ